MYSDTVVVALKRPDHVFAVAYAVEPSASVCKTFRLKVKLPRQIIIRCDYTPIDCTEREMWREQTGNLPRRGPQHLLQEGGDRR